MWWNTYKKTFKRSLGKTSILGTILRIKRRKREEAR
jgi:hypothetical protein